MEKGRIGGRLGGKEGRIEWLDRVVMVVETKRKGRGNDEEKK